MAWTGATCARPDRRDVAVPKRNGRDELRDSQSGFQSGAGSRRARDLCCRALQLDHRLRDSPATRGTVLDVANRRRGSMAFAPSDGIPAADAMVATRCSSDAPGSHIRRQRQLRLRSCRRRTMGSASVSERGMTTHPQVLNGLEILAKKFERGYGQLARAEIDGYPGIPG
jgi:hypothetical protein